MADDLFVKEEKKEVAVQEKGVLDAARAPGTEGIGSDDIQLGRYRLLQSLSSDVAGGDDKPGLIKESSSGVIFKVLEIIPLSMFKSRILFNSENRKGGPLCRNIDADLKHGSGSPDPASNSECVKCTYSKGFPPACSVVYNYPCIRPDQVGKEPLPSLLSIMKSSTAVAQKINTFVMNKIPSRPLWDYVWEISGKSRDFKKGTAFILEAKMKRETTNEERAWAKAVYNSGIAGKRIEPEFDEGDAE
jgi:hypothetical protein